MPFTRYRVPLNSLSPAIQQRLADAILEFATGPDGVWREHALHNGAHGFGVWEHDPAIFGFGVIPSGRGATFFRWHHDYLERLQQHLTTLGLTLPSWAPWEDIPPAFMRRIRGRPAVTQEAFAIYSDDVVGHWEDEDAFGVQMSWGPHFAVHALTGGDMAIVDYASRAPIFWPWHAFLDDLHHTWRVRREKYGNNQPTPPYFPFCWTGASTGTGPGRRVLVPFCIGRTLTGARQALEGAGLRLGQTDSNAGGDRIVTQDPLPFVAVPPGTAVKLSMRVSEVVHDTAARFWPPRPPF